MIITGKRKLKLDKYLSRLPKGTTVIPGFRFTDNSKNILLKIGFSDSFSEGETILPPSKFGPICLFNAEGKEIIHKDKPMETAYRQIEWTWKQWSGRYDTETMSKLVDVPYKRYPRSFIPPPSI
ncbi:hypothetical protein [Desulfobacterium sp. N47]|uniref:Uncharacterized protein n=1 Tax=uncultured Desulfobacterium sp. TaxID=201089 RepID=E1YCI4_9BACT|nr:hypothetical protein N47_G36020 [uncultured Desulfobacterium sp.]